MVFFACSYVDATTVDIYTHKFDREDLEDGYEDGLSHTMEFFNMLEKNWVWVQGLEASQFVLDIVRTGYRLPFITFPPPLEADNHQSALEHATFVEESIRDLVQARCVQESVSTPTVCSPLQVVSNARGNLGS